MAILFCGTGGGKTSGPADVVRRTGGLGSGGTFAGRPHDSSGCFARALHRSTHDRATRLDVGRRSHRHGPWLDGNLRADDSNESLATTVDHAEPVGRDTTSPRRRGRCAAWPVHTE